jgi:hypothetical protein
MAEGKLTGGATVESGFDRTRRLPLDAEELSRLRDKIHEHTIVFDEFEERVGTVEAYDPKTGYMRLDVGRLAPKPVFLPATAVSYLDDLGLHLSVGKDAMASLYTVIPDVAKESLAR